jgi:hypothetical protein
MNGNKTLAIAMLVIFVIFSFTTAIVSTVRRNRRSAKSFSRDDPINIWSSSNQDGQRHGHGGHGGGGTQHGGWSGSGDGGHHGGWSGGGGDGGSVGGHHG